MGYNVWNHAKVGDGVNFPLTLAFVACPLMCCSNSSHTSTNCNDQFYMIHLQVLWILYTMDDSLPHLKLYSYCSTQVFQIVGIDCITVKLCMVEYEHNASSKHQACVKCYSI